MNRSTPPRHEAPPTPLDLPELLCRLQRLAATANNLLNLVNKRPMP